jgi:hypothetical protein
MTERLSFEKNTMGHLGFDPPSAKIDKRRRRDMGTVTASTVCVTGRFLRVSQSLGRVQE